MQLHFRIRTMTANPYAGIVVRPFLRRAIPYIIGFRGCANLTGPDFIEESGHPLNMLYFVAVTDRIAVIMRLIGITLFPCPDKLGVDPLPLQFHPTFAYRIGNMPIVILSFHFRGKTKLQMPHKYLAVLLDHISQSFLNLGSCFTINGMLRIGIHG